MAPKINQVKPDESTNNENLANEGINEIASPQKPSKLKTAVNNAIAKLWIALSLIGGNGAFNVVSLGTAGAIVAACEKPDDIGPEIIKEVKEIPISGGEIFTITGNQVKVGNTVIQEFWDDVSANNVTISSNFDGSTISSGKPIDKSGRVTSIARDQAGNPSETARTHITKKETAEKPKYSLHIPEITISQGDTVTRPQNGKEIFAGTQKIFAWDNDDYTFSTNIDLPYPVNNDIDVTFSLSIKGGQPETRTTKIKVNQVDNNQAPEVTREYPQDKVPNILGGVTVKGDNNQLTFGDVVMYIGKDDNTEVCTVSLKLNDEEKIGKKISESSTYILTYTDKDGKSSSPIEFPVISESIDLTNLDNLNMQVNQEVDLLKGIKVPSGIEIIKVEVEINGESQEVKAENGHYLYTPDQAGTCYIYVTEKGEFGNTYVERTKNPLTIKDIEHQEYQAIEINNIRPVDILPIIGQVEVGDKKAYEHIEHLRVAEATRIIDMMWEYGTGKHSPEEYQELMMRLNTGMLRETPIGWDNYETVGGSWNDGSDPMGHAYREYHILNTLIKYANFKVIDNANHRENLYNLCKANPTKFNIMGLSASADVDKEQYDARHEEKYKEYDKEKNRIVFCSGSNIRNKNGIIQNKIYQEDYLVDEHGLYCERSRAHSKNDNILNRHLFLTISTDKNGNIDQTNEDTQTSKFPVGFHNKVLFAGRDFPSRYGPDKKIRADNGKYPTSFTNYFNVALTDLCFQVRADVKDADELLDMIRSTALTDYIRFDLNGDGDTNDNIDGQPETQPLQLINPAGVFEKYCMIADIPSSIHPGETVSLDKKRYKGLIFDIPGAEVKINGQWIAYEKSNESLIKSQNPMNLEWRLNGDLVAKYSKNGTVTGKIIAVDDQRNGLNMEKEGITINLDRGVEWSMVDIPYGIYPGETIMLTNGSTKGLIYDIPGAQMYIEGKSWVTYNDKNKKLIESQDLKNAYWRLNGDIARETTRNTYIKGTVFAFNDKGSIIDKRNVYVNLENNTRNHNSYIAQGDTKNEGLYSRSEKGGDKNEGSYQRSEKGYSKGEGNYRKS